MAKARALVRQDQFDGVPLRVIFDSLEGFLTSEWGFGFKEAMPIQRAVCWVLDTGTIPDHLWEAEHVAEAFGGVRPTEFRDEFLMICGIRSAKTLICAAACAWKALTVDLSAGAGTALRSGEILRASLVSRFEDQATVAFNYIVGAMLESPVLSALIVGQPTTDTITMRHPSGRLVEIMVVAMSASGVSLVSRWCVACVFDEAPRMASEDEGKINLEAQVLAVRARLLTGGFIAYIGSPLGAKGKVYETYQKNWQNPAQSLPVVKADARWLNPVHWTKERCEKLEREAPDAFECDVKANFIDNESQLFPTATIEAITRASPLAVPYDPTKRYSAAMDPAMSVNAWTLVIAETDNNRLFRVACATEWRGSTSAPLSTKQVLVEIKALLDEYHIASVVSDQFAFGPIKDLAYDLGFGVSEMKFTAESKKQLYMNLRTRAVTGLLELPPIPEMKRDLQNVKKRFTGTTAGGFAIDLVETSDGRHADFAPALAIICGGYLEESKPAEPKAPALTSIASMGADELEELEDRLEQQDWLYSDEPGELSRYDEGL